MVAGVKALLFVRAQLGSMADRHNLISHWQTETVSLISSFSVKPVMQDRYCSLPSP